MKFNKKEVIKKINFKKIKGGVIGEPWFPIL